MGCHPLLFAPIRCICAKKYVRNTNIFEISEENGKHLQKGKRMNIIIHSKFQF